ncbi:MAG: ferrous iron transport protein B [Chloroflexota bacterium]
MSKQTRRPITVALAGQPNVGKSTVFNMLTGLNQHVGNWPGKTIEQKSGEYRRNDRVVCLMDLPGTYSLSANSEEERIARNFIIRQKPDVVVVIVNAAALERNLYLVAEMLMLPLPVVVGLNMMDVANGQGVQVEPHVLEATLGAPVVPLVASKNQGLGELIDAAERVAENPALFSPNRPAIRPEHQPILEQIHALIAGQVPPPYPEDWVALKLLEGDTEIAAMIQQAAPQAWEHVHLLLMQHEDAYLDIAGGRYEWIGRMVRAAVVRPRAGALTLTDRLDKIATHPLAGLALLLGIFAFVFWLTYTLATPLVDWLDAGVISPLAEAAEIVLAATPAWLSGLIIDGIIGGAGTVLTFLPILLIFFAVLGVLEDVGYLARAAYVMDRFMHWMGLHGKSFLPLFLGFGCNVPAVMGTRILEDRRARLLTILLAPLVPCTARLAVVAFLAPAFFGKAAALVSWGLVAGNILLLVFLGIVLNRLVFKGARSAFIMEMPLYHLPNLRTIGLFVWHNALAFLRKAGSIIVVFSALIWVLSVLPGGDIHHSLLATLGRWLGPIGRLMGLTDWRMMVALLSSFIAKENTIAALGILYGTNAGEIGLATRLAATLTPAAALAFLVVQMTFIPCVATMAVIKQETASWKWTAVSVGLLLLLSFLAGVSTYRLSHLIGW